MLHVLSLKRNKPTVFHDAGINALPHPRSASTLPAVSSCSVPRAAAKPCWPRLSPTTPRPPSYASSGPSSCKSISARGRGWSGREPERYTSECKSHVLNPLRDVFRLAKENSPAIIFIDEIDAIATKRFDAQTGADREVQRILLELLNQGLA